MEIDRRNLIKLGLVSSLGILPSGCKHRLSSELPVAKGISIDIHNHIFNARDIPIQGFLSLIHI